MLLPIPDIYVHVGLFRKVVLDVGSLDHAFGMFMISWPPDGIWFFGVSVKVNGE